MNQKSCIAIIDYGSQYTQIIAKRIRSFHVYTRIYPHNTVLKELTRDNSKGIILSGGPRGIYEKEAFRLDTDILHSGIPIMGICYGMQILIEHFGGHITKGQHEESGHAELTIHKANTLLTGLPKHSTVWMSHRDSITKIPEIFELLGSTKETKHAIIKHKNLYGIQFHPEVSHSEYGTKILQNFACTICGVSANWQTASFIDSSTAKIRTRVGKEKVICALSGGIDSTVTALLIHAAIGAQLDCIFVNTGFLRKNEQAEITAAYTTHFPKLTVIDASEQFLTSIKGIHDPEEKRKRIGHNFIAIFEKEAQFRQAKFLAQGTLYPDIIESTATHSSPIKTHHNVGGLPEHMNLQLIEPLKELFKDEVRELGKELELNKFFLERHPFPGPGLAIRILGEVTRERLRILQEADHILINALKEHKLYTKIWQAFAVLLPIQSVGVTGDKRSYENVLAIRCVNSEDGMTAIPYPFPHDTLTAISQTIINKVHGINRIVYDISSKPPATIEWE